MKIRRSGASGGPRCDEINVTPHSGGAFLSPTRRRRTVLAPPPLSVSPSFATPACSMSFLSVFSFFSPPGCPTPPLALSRVRAPNLTLPFLVDSRCGDLQWLPSRRKDSSHSRDLGTPPTPPLSSYPRRNPFPSRSPRLRLGPSSIPLSFFLVCVPRARELRVYLSAASTTPSRAAHALKRHAKKRKRARHKTCVRATSRHPLPAAAATTPPLVTHGHHQPPPNPSRAQEPRLPLCETCVPPFAPPAPPRQRPAPGSTAGPMVEGRARHVLHHV